ncbi:hypothetical protein [Mycolicibacterium vaccae]|uniref:hypothetical protein n=1 Tax=Mycolicibacterium vaccae TaxID=1810 RepID=UPI003D06A044
MGLSLTSTSAVWVLLDTSSGTILADEVVPVAAVEEVAKAAALSVQTFTAQTEHRIDRVHLTWTPDGQHHGVRLRTKLRLFGFDDIETFTGDEAREGRNRTARHIAPHLAMAYGAARAEHADASGSALQKLTALVPHPAVEPGGFRARWSQLVDDARVSVQTAAARMPVRIAGGVAAAAVLGLVAYALTGTTSPVTPTPSQAGVVAEPAPGAAPVPSPQPVVARPDTAAAAVPEVAVPEVAVAEPVAQWTPVGESLPVTESVPVPTWSVPEAVPQSGAVVEAVTPSAPAEATPSALEVGAEVGQAHLSGDAPVLGPVAVSDPVAVVAPVAPPVAPEPPPGPLSQFLGALP